MEKIAVNTADAPVSEVLREAREELNLTRSEAARQAGIPIDYLAFFEGDSERSPSADIYVRNRLKQYCAFLDVDPETSTRRFFRERQPERKDEERPEAPTRKHPLKSIPSTRLFVTSNIVKSTLALLAAVGVATYVGLAAQRLVAPPRVDVSYPKDGLVTFDKTMVVEGSTEKEVNVTINGKAVHADGSGRFSDRLDLHEGLNVIKVVATKKHGQSTEVTRRIVVRPRVRPTANVELPQ